MNRTKYRVIPSVTEQIHACLKWLCPMDPLVNYLQAVIEQITSVFKIGSMFKKRLNFLNSAPTSAESALRLLTSPSVRF